MARHLNGWVKLYRKAALGDINSNFTRGGLFGALVAMANIQSSIAVWRGKPRKVERGEIVTSLSELASLGECDVKTVSRHLNYLVLRETILIEKSSTGTFIKILNYEKYQGQDAEDSKPCPNDIPDDREIDVQTIGIHNEELKNKRIKELKNTNVELPRLAILWNEHSGQLSKVLKSNKNRNKRAALRLSEHSEGEWIAIIKKIANSQFCNGKNESGWKATFDWILQPDTALKTIEGKYDDRVPQNKSQLSEGYKHNESEDDVRKALGL